MRERERDTAPRGRHAPPLEVRQDRQRRRLYAAAGAIFARVGYAAYVDEVNREDATRFGAARFASPHDAFAIVGAVVELASRQIRTGEPDDIRDLEPVVERLVLGLMHAA